MAWGLRRRYVLTFRGRDVVLGEKTWVMGILNVTPDSFSDGGRFASADAAIAAGLRLFDEGADIVDVGGESTRPGGASRIDADEEIRRVVPVLEGLRKHAAGFVSVDTTKTAVARAALDAGADMVNDVSGLSFDPRLASLVAERRVPVVLMHIRGDFATMHREPSYDNVFAEVASEMLEAAARAEASGVSRGAILLDPGIGFAKNVAHSLEVLARTAEMGALGFPLVVGPSRKSFIGATLDVPVDARLMGTAAAVAACALGGAHVVRVHDVREMVQVVRLCDAIRDGLG